MKKSMLIATAFLALLTAQQAAAADVGVSPAFLAMSVAGGESGATTVVGKVNNPPATPYSVAIQLRPAGGSLPPAWLTTQPAKLTNLANPLLLTLTVRVPATAAPGTYTAMIQPVVTSSTIPLAPAARPLLLTVSVTSKCAAAPAVSIASAAPAAFKSPNGRLADVSVSGTIVPGPGCTLGRAWYTLVDEYGVLGETKDIAVDPDGSFGFTAPVQVSRRGDDADGRLYQISVHAANEKGSGSSAPASVVVLHDQRGAK